MALAGCGSSSQTPVASASSVSPSTAPSAIAAGAWLDGGHAVAVVSMGGSSCPPHAGEVTASGQTVTVDFATSSEQCTLDLAPRLTYVVLPAGVVATKDVVIKATGVLSGGVTLTALASASGGGDMAPSAGWIQAVPGTEVQKGGFAFVTWGSSTCPPGVGDVTAEGASAMTLTLVSVTGHPCTADMAPRVGASAAPDSVTGSDVRLTFRSIGEGSSAGPTGTTTVIGTR